MSNPIVDFENDDFVVWGKKTLERKNVDLEPFLKELEVLMDEERLNESPELYKRHPEVRVGLRRAMLVVQKRKKV